MAFPIQVPRLVAIGPLNGWSIGTMVFPIQVPRLVAIIILNCWAIVPMEFTIQEPLGFFFSDLYCVFGNFIHHVSLLISYYTTLE
jgi:hypothetical protein